MVLALLAVSYACRRISYRQVMRALSVNSVFTSDRVDLLTQRIASIALNEVSPLRYCIWLGLFGHVTIVEMVNTGKPSSDWYQCRRRDFG